MERNNIEIEKGLSLNWFANEFWNWYGCYINAYTEFLIFNGTRYMVMMSPYGVEFWRYYLEGEEKIPFDPDDIDSELDDTRFVGVRNRCGVVAEFVVEFETGETLPSPYREMAEFLDY